MNPLLIIAWVWQPVGSPLHIIGGAAVLCGLAVFAYARTFRGRPVASSVLLVMRLAFVSALAVLLMGPSRMPPDTSAANRPRLSILVDTSESMQTADTEGTSRFRFAATRLLDAPQLQKLAQDYQLELNGFDEKLHPLSAEQLRKNETAVATGKSTYLVDSVTAGLSKIPPHDEGAILCVISDGRDTQDAPIQPAATLARSRKIPIFSVGLGGETLEKDAALLAVPMQPYLLPGEPGAILVKVYQAGMGGAATTLKLNQSGQVETFPVVFNHKSVVELQLPIRHQEPGLYEYSVSIDPVEEEKETANNSQVVFCEVHKKRIRILMLEGEPFWDSKFLAQSLRKDERIELTQITQVTQQKKETIVSRAGEGAPKVPVTLDEWARYDVVILGQSIEHILDRQSASQLKAFVSERGGHLIFARGRSYRHDSPQGQEIEAELGVLEPVVWGVGELEKVSLSLTPSGRTSPWFSTTKMGTNVDDAFNRLPGFEVMPVIEREKPATIVLVRASLSGAANAGSTTYPGIVRMAYGRGIVVGVLGNGLWQWSLLSPDRQDLSGFYDTFWSNLVRWLSMGGDFPPGQQVALQLDRTSVRLGDPVLVDVVYKAGLSGRAPPALSLTLPSGESRTITMAPVPGREPRFRVEIKPETTGVYQLTLQALDAETSKLERKFNVYDVNLERLQSSANLMPLRVLAEYSGGQFMDAKTAGDLAGLLHRHRTSMLVPPKLEYIWDQSIVMTCLLIWAGVEWLLRRMAGLL
jgi:hypothetical protein